MQGRRYRPARGRARLGAALDQGSDRVAPAQRRRVPEHARRRARGGRRPRGLRVELVGVRRPPRSLPKHEDRIGKPLSPYAVTKRIDELYAQVFDRLRTASRSSASATSTCSGAARTPTGVVRGRHPALDRRTSIERQGAMRHLRRRLEQPRLLLRRQHRAGEHPRRRPPSDPTRSRARSTTAAATGAPTSSSCSR